MALPLITTQPRSTVVEAGDVVMFECTANSHGITSIIWKKMNSQLPVNANVTITKSPTEITSVLRIERTIKYYEGYYYCIIENSAGQVQSSSAYCKITSMYLNAYSLTHSDD